MLLLLPIAKNSPYSEVAGCNKDDGKSWIKNVRYTCDKNKSGKDCVNKKH